MNSKEPIKTKSNCGESDFITLVDMQKDILYKTAYIYVHNKEDALDILQETIYKAYMSFNKLKNLKYFNTWITRVLINSAIDLLKKNRRTAELTHMILLYESENSRIDREDIIDVYAAIDKLDKKQREIIKLMYFNGFTLNEISEIMECPIGTVKSNLHKALGLLRLELKECINDV